MAIERTNTNLALFCLSVLGAPYWFACYGNVASESLFNQKRNESQNKKYYDSWPKSTFTDDYGKRVTDCSGLLKWFLFSDNMTNKNPVNYKASEDFGATTFYNKCTEKGKIATLPKNKVGLLVFNGNDTTKTHMGVIVDNDGTVVEAKGHAYGVVKSKASSWGYWGRCHLIKYTDAPNKDTYTVITQYQPLTVRKEPTTKSEAVDELARGSSFTSTDIVKGEPVKGCDVWVGVKGGYASGYYLAPTPKLPPDPTEKNYRVKVNSFLSIRNTPEENDRNKVGELYNGAVVSIIKVNGSWGLISGEAWVSMNYLEPI